MARNGTNAKMFGAWSGLSADESTKQVPAHLKAVAGATAWPKLKKFIGDVDTPVVVIASCKAIQALQILDFNHSKRFKVQGPGSWVFSFLTYHSSGRIWSIHKLRNFCFHSARSHLASKRVPMQKTHSDLDESFSSAPRQLDWGRDSAIGSGNTRCCKGRQAGAS